MVKLFIYFNQNIKVYFDLWRVQWREGTSAWKNAWGQDLELYLKKMLVIICLFSTAYFQEYDNLSGTESKIFEK